MKTYTEFTHKQNSRTERQPERASGLGTYGTTEFRTELNTEQPNRMNGVKQKVQMYKC